jgi:autotransporter-associated beta strand protein
MKPTTPHDPLDDLIAAALHGDLTPEERTQFESRLQSDPNAQAAYQEAQAMHDLLEQTNKSAQPDPNFEQRMVSGVRRKIANPPHQETAWESLLILWKTLTSAGKFIPRLRWKEAIAVCVIIAILAGVAFGPITAGTKQARQMAELQQAKELQSQIDDLKTQNAAPADLKKVIQDQGINYVDTAQKGVTLSGYVNTNYAQQFGGKAVPFGAPTSGNITFSGANTYTGGTTVSAGNLIVGGTGSLATYNGADAGRTPQGGTVRGSGFTVPAHTFRHEVTEEKVTADTDAAPSSSNQQVTATLAPPAAPAALADDAPVARNADLPKDKLAFQSTDKSDGGLTPDGIAALKTAHAPNPVLASKVTAAAPDTRKLIRNAQLELEVKSYQSAIDQVSALTKSAGGYVDTSSSQRGGNGKLQGTVVVKILPENLDAFLLKLRDLGQVQNQSVSTDDVTKEYFDTQARLANSQKMEVQLQELLKRENGKVSDLLAVERELGRVRGDIEQMQGQLKLYDFQVQYATVTMSIAEKDLNQTAAYLLKEQDNFSLYATDVEGAFQKARAAADQFNAQVLSANLEHDVRQR